MWKGEINNKKTLKRLQLGLQVGDSPVRVIFIALKIYDYIQSVKRKHHRAGAGGLRNSHVEGIGKGKKNEGKEQKQWLEVGVSGNAESQKARQKKQFKE